MLGFLSLFKLSYRPFVPHLFKATTSSAFGNVHKPLNIKYKRKEKVLEVLFENGVSFRYPAEYLRVLSPSAEVQGHSLFQKKVGRIHPHLLILH